MSVESYLHKFAKQTVATWIRGRVKVGAKFKGLQPMGDAIPFGMEAPMCGVYEEYPILRDRTGLQRVCCQSDDVADADRCNHLTGWHCYVHSNPGKLTIPHKHGIPTLKALSEAKMPAAECVFDVGVIDTTGKLCCVVEICHTNPMNAKKIKWLTDNNVTWYEISAEWVMKQIRSPYSVAEGLYRYSGSPIRASPPSSASSPPSSPSSASVRLSSTVKNKY
jgi:hypothetical protein